MANELLGTLPFFWRGKACKHQARGTLCFFDSVGFWDYQKLHDNSKIAVISITFTILI